MQSHTGTWEVMNGGPCPCRPRLCPSVRIARGSKDECRKSSRMRRCTLDPFQFVRNRAFCLCGLQAGPSGVLWLGPYSTRIPFWHCPGSPERLLCSFCRCGTAVMRCPWLGDEGHPEKQHQQVPVKAALKGVVSLDEERNGTRPVSAGAV